MVVLALEVGGRWSTATETFLRGLARRRTLASRLATPLGPDVDRCGQHCLQRPSPAPGRSRRNWPISSPTPAGPSEPAAALTCHASWSGSQKGARQKNKLEQISRLKRWCDWKQVAADADRWMMEGDEFIKFCTQYVNSSHRLFVVSSLKRSQVSPNARRRAQCKGGGGKEKSIYVHTNDCTICRRLSKNVVAAFTWNRNLGKSEAKHPIEPHFSQHFPSYPEL